MDTYFLLPFLLLTVAKKKNQGKNAILLTTGICLHLIAIATSETEIGGDYPLDIYHGYPALLRCFAGYLFGIISISIYQSGLKSFFQQKKVLYTLITLIVILLLFQKADLLIVILFIPLMVGLAQRNTFISTILQSKAAHFLGSISYPLYLIHYIVLFKYDRARIMLLSWHLNHLSVGCYLFIILLLSAAFAYWVEKPLLAYLLKKWIKPTAGSIS